MFIVIFALITTTRPLNRSKREDGDYTTIFSFARITKNNPNHEKQSLKTVRLEYASRPPKTRRKGAGNAKEEVFMADGIYTNEQHWREIGGKTVFTTGASIEEREINGKWHWVVVAFEDDTFWDGMTLDVNETADTREKLVTLDAEDETQDEETAETDEETNFPVFGHFESEEETDDQADYLLFGHNDGDFINIVPQD
jgi:hypothetical protein